MLSEVSHGKNSILDANEVVKHSLVYEKVDPVTRDPFHCDVFDCGRYKSHDRRLQRLIKSVQLTRQKKKTVMFGWRCLIKQATTCNIRNF